MFTCTTTYIYYAQEVRGFSLVMFLASISVLSFLNLFYRKGNRIVWGVILMFANAFLMYTHFLTIFLFVAQLVFVVLYWRRTNGVIGLYLISQLGAAILFAPWVYYLLQNIPEKGTFWLQSPTFENLFFGFWQLAGSRASLFFVLILLSLIAIKPIANRLHFELRDKEVFTFFLLLWGLPILMEFVIGQFTPIFLLRYFLYAGIGFIMVQVIIFESINIKYGKYILFAFSLLFLIVYIDLKPEKEENWKEVSDFLSEHKASNDAIFISASYKSKDLCYYYKPELFRQYHQFENLLSEEDIFFDISKFENELSNFRKVYLVLSHHLVVDPGRTIDKYFNDNFIYKETHHFANIDLHIYEKGGSEIGR